MSSATPRTISRDIDAAERNARGQLIANDRLVAVRANTWWALRLILVVPAIVFTLELVVWLTGSGPGWFSWGWLVSLTLLVPAGALL